MRALGSEYAGLFTNNDKLAAHLIKAGEETGEKLWRLPLSKDYDQQMDSEIADIRNISTNPNAGGSTAACFLQRFLKVKHLPWAHLDIAGVDDETKGKPLCPKGATAFGIRLLNKFIRG